jgi:hypothetical protein
MAALPRSPWIFAFFAASLSSAAILSSIGSIITSTRLTKKLATDAIRSIGFPSATRRSSARMYAQATASYASIANRRVTLTLIPSESSFSIAGTPGGKPGTLIIRFGRSTHAQSRRASSRVPSVS